MVECITAETVSGSEAVLGLLRRHYHFVQCKRVFVELDVQVFNVFSDINFNADADISQAGCFQNVLSLLDIFEDIVSFDICDSPKVIFADSDNSTDDRIA